MSHCVKQAYDRFKNIKEIWQLQYPEYFKNELSICHEECGKKDEISTSVIRHGPISSKSNVLMDGSSMYDIQEKRF